MYFLYNFFILLYKMPRAPSNINDISLFESVKQEAIEKFERYPSIYASSWITREYKKRGGTYKDQKINTKEQTMFNIKGQNRWYAESWIQVIPYIRENKVIQCGASNKHTKACRPLYRITEQTPITINELIELHGTEKILKLATQKIKI
jgi:hypothetical protein